MQYIFIDGNNLIGYLQKAKKKTFSRSDLIIYLERYFANKKNNIYVFFDGYPNEIVASNIIKIIYSKNKTADETIRIEIENYINSKKVTVVTSDRNLQEIAKVNYSKVISCEDFIKNYLNKNHSKQLDDDKPKVISDDEIKKLFDVE